MDIQTDLTSVLLSAVSECNEYGHFIQTTFMITNIKTFSPEDIERELSKP
jgi:hypothetical protein